MFTIDDLIGFGNYLLSMERVLSYMAATDEELLPLHIRLSRVTDADLANFFHENYSPEGITSLDPDIDDSEAIA